MSMQVVQIKHLLTLCGSQSTNYLFQILLWNKISKAKAMLNDECDANLNIKQI